MNAIARSRTVRSIRSAVIGAAIGWLVSAIWLTPPLKEWEGIVVLFFLVVICILHLAE